MVFVILAILEKDDKTEGSKIPISYCVLLMQSSPFTFVKIKSF
jgi:hypothetical protein